MSPILRKGPIVKLFEPVLFLADKVDELAALIESPRLKVPVQLRTLLYPSFVYMKRGVYVEVRIIPTAEFNCNLL